MAKQSGAPPAVHTAPCVALQLKAASWSSDTDEISAFETRAAEAASRFGRVLDVRLASGTGTTRIVRIYFADVAGAVCCSTRFTCNGVTRESFEYENMEPPSLVTFRDLPKPKDASELARDVGIECGEFGRVLDAQYVDDTVVISFSTPSGAAAASIALDGAAFDGFRCATFFGSQSEEPCCVLRGPLDGVDDDLSQMEVVGDVEEACAMLGEVRSVSSRDGAILIAYDENRGAAACARTMHGRVFDGREVTATAALRGGFEAEAELCAAVVNALEVKPPERPIEKKKELTKEDTLKKAIQALRKAVLAQPSDVQLRNNLAGALTRIGGVGELEEACRHATHATRLKPDDAWGHYRLGVARFQKGDVAKAQTALRLASSLAPDRQDFADIAAKADEAALALLDPMDAFAARAEAEAKKALVDSEAKARREKETQRFGKGKRKLEDDSDDEGELLNVNSRAHCYICKQWGHSKKDCPLARCQYCHEIGHRKSDCPLFTQALQNAAEEEKKARRKQGYEKKKLRRKEEWTKMLREQTGVDGFAALYRVLGLPERKLATASEIKKAYHKRSLAYHPDKHPDDPDGAKERFLEIKAAYELLLEGMETGGLGGKAVFSAGELTDAAAASALQEKVKALEKKVKASAAWSG